ncbi:putative ribonuclease H-like domain-containing protein [Tanacetum coccineum]
MTHLHLKRNFVPTAVATKSGRVPVNAAKQNSQRAEASISPVRPVNTVAPKLKVNTARVNNVTTSGPKIVVSATEGNRENAIKSLACWIWIPTGNVIDHTSKDSGSYMLIIFDYVDLQGRLNGCSRYMTGNKFFLTNYQEIDGGFVAFGGSPKGGKITRKGKIKTGKLDFEDVYFVQELKFNLFSILQMCDKKNNVLFTNTECLVLSHDFKLLDESQVLLKVPRHDNMYSFDLKNVVPLGGLTCLFSKRLGHINFKIMNKLVRGNLARGLPSKLFENDHTCVACQKGKQHKPSGSRPDWLFDIDLLTNSMSYELVIAGNQTNKNTYIKDNVDAVPTQQYMLLPLLPDSLPSSKDAGKKTTKEPVNEGKRNGQEKKRGTSNKEGDQNVQDLRAELDKLLVQHKEGYANTTNRDSNVSHLHEVLLRAIMWAKVLITLDECFQQILLNKKLPDLEDTTDLLNPGIFSGAYDNEDKGEEANLNNLETIMNVSPIPTTKIYKHHPKDQIIGDINSATQTRRMTKISEEHAMVRYINKQRRTNHKDYQNCLFACYLSEKEPNKVIQALDDPSWIEAIKRVIRNKKDERGMVVRNKARLVAQGYTQEEGIDYDEVYVDDIIFGSTKKSLCVEFEQMMHKRFQMSSMGELTFFLGLQVKHKDDGIVISQDKYVADILKKFDFATVKTTSTSIETNKALLKDEEAEDVDVHLYRSMIGSLMFLTASRPDIMFAVCACARFQVTLKVSYLHAVKRIFRYLKDSDYAGASLDRKFTTRCCQFLGKRLISWKCKKKTIVANSTTEVEYVAAANCCGQVLWIQNQMLDYGFNFMNTKIYIDNKSTMCILKNPVFHSKTKHIEIRHHFIRDSYENRLIQVIKICNTPKFGSQRNKGLGRVTSQIHNIR